MPEFRLGEVYRLLSTPRYLEGRKGRVASNAMLRSCFSSSSLASGPEDNNVGPSNLNSHERYEARRQGLTQGTVR